MRIAMKHTSACLFAALSALGTMGLTGCEDPVKAPPEGYGDLLARDNYPRIVALEGLSEALRFGPPIVDASTDAAPMKVTVPVRSVEDKYPLNVQYRFEFLDSGRRPLSETAGWKFLHLEPRVEAFMTGSALQTSAVDWRLEVRPAR